ncbi:uncharacterized protein LOC118674701 [Myotis myotis]|uniref:uncharacterized protein LOC118674701 n=1 Tax=Myotis myotis TaxID=51298 RepID=UPI00174A69F2|nr:uncharacterized protein LOC118674701 [Myotis myotis]
MLRLLPALALLGALAAPAVAGLGLKQPGPHGAVPGDLGAWASLISPPQPLSLENGTLIKNGSCVAPRECPEGVYALTYAPNSSLSTACCDNNCSRVARPEEVQPNGVKCHYCSGNRSAPCDSLSVMNCTGHQTACVTLKGTWDRGGPPMLKGCATPALCNLPVNSTLGPEAFGFHLTARPECYHEAPPTQPGTRATLTYSKAKATTCFTCSDSDHCRPFSCPAERSYCLQTAGILALGEGDSVAWRNGSCVASKDCKFDNPISALTYSIGFGFWVNTTCCQGSCPEPTLPATLPASRTLSKFLCPTCAEGHLGLCNSSLYMQCPRGETTCVQLDLVSEEGGRNLSVRGCGSRDLCSAPQGTEGLRALPGHRLARRPDCSSGKRAVIDSSSSSGAAPGPRLALPALVALVARALA